MNNVKLPFPGRFHNIFEIPLNSQRLFRLTIDLFHRKSLTYMKDRRYIRMLFSFVTNNLPRSVFHQVLLYSLLCSALRCHALICSGLLCPDQSCPFLSCSSLSCPVFTNPISTILSHPVLFYPIMSCPVIVLQYHAMSYSVLPCPASHSALPSVTLSALRSVLICPFPLSVIIYGCQDMPCGHLSLI